MALPPQIASFIALRDKAMTSSHTGLHIIFFPILMSTFINLDRYAFLPPYVNVHSIYHGDAW